MLLIEFLAGVAASQFTSRYLDPLLNIPGTDCSHKIGGLLLQESLMIWMNLYIVELVLFQFIAMPGSVVTWLSAKLTLLGW